ncbi:MAG TPA: hypothetical protein VHD62_09265 [Opitutaceae bacterium]|nr:hypothetical protein [Opitutaceae bacterium]
MKLIWHIAKKDLRRMALPAGLWVAFIVGSAIWFRTASAGTGIQSGEAMVGWLPMMRIWAQLFTIAQFIIGYLLAGALVLEDPVIGTDTFWLTRPIANARLLVAKLLAVALLFVVAPAVGLALVRLACGFSPGEIWQATRALGVNMGLAAAFSVMVASLSRNLVQFLFGFVALAAVGVMTMGRFLVPPTDQFAPMEWAELVASRILVANFVLGCGIVLVLGWQFLTRRRVWGWLILASIFVACVSIRVAWPWNTWAAWNASETASAVPPEAHASIVTKAISLHRYPDRFAERLLQMNATLTVTPGRTSVGVWYAPAAGRVDITWENSTPRYSISLDRFGGSWADACALAYLQGQFEPAIAWHLFGATSSRAQLPSGEARISGRCEIWSARVRIAGELPMTSGGELVEHGNLSRVMAVESSIGWDKVLVIEEHELNFGQAAEVFALLNRRTKQALVVSQNELGRVDMNGETAVLRRLFVPAERPDETWRRDAVLVKVRIEPVHRFFLPFEAHARVIEETR